MPQIDAPGLSDRPEAIRSIMNQTSDLRGNGTRPNVASKATPCRGGQDFAFPKRCLVPFYSHSTIGGLHGRPPERLPASHGPLRGQDTGRHGAGLEVCTGHLFPVRHTDRRLLPADTGSGGGGPGGLYRTEADQEREAGQLLRLHGQERHRLLRGGEAQGQVPDEGRDAGLARTTDGTTSTSSTARRTCPRTTRMTASRTTPGDGR